MTRNQTYRWLLYFLMHIPLAYFMKMSTIFGLAHVILILAMGTSYAVRGQILKVAYVCAYITGAEVLWRGMHAAFLYEMGKYAVCFLMIITFYIRGMRKALLPIFYFLMLIPGIFLTTEEALTFEIFRKLVSFNLSGPFALMICVIFFSQYRFPKEKIHNLFLVILGPIVGIAFNAVSRTYEFSQKGELVFRSTGSNFITSGSGGPNQVSAMFGLGVFLLFFYLIENKKSKIRFIATAMMVWFAVQSALTFSRGGLYAVAVALLPASVFLIQNPRIRNQIIAVSIMVFLLGNFVILPKLSKFTGGALDKRFSSTKTSGRDILMKTDLEIWKNNFVFGVGPGESSRYHFDGAAAHTEFTRLLSEHGLFGLIAMLFLMSMAFRAFMQAKTNAQKGLVVGMIVWSFAFMCTSAMRLVAPSFIFGLAGMKILPEVFPRTPKNTTPLVPLSDAPK